VWVRLLYLIFVQLVNLVLLLGRSSASKDVERHSCIEAKGVPAVAQSSKTGPTSPVDNYDKSGI
jgi:hypothetical protein